ncbi:MAG: transcriptional regulator [Flammeovirgaceae bacterium]|jgi:ArsR family transcriptional regulator|nr:transcriptional regulator [Flammeovirgaceae bacterium]MBF27751.1 transcriptional regulator [Flammeovirgaceae bacterium]MEC7244245.1 metalloregulator ArsR/SmtB family transcription factor [Bacteroidota bacterium]MEC8701861.1 metalloregulator ArsR/SmtB family transcription factor [Bacteroidota bacterium]|tara:strand:- start:369 stop:752 length:384 start_codon:yes stop_codon:yes gene_type:complete
MRLKKFNIEYGKTIFKSFSDVSRIRILNILANRKEASISDLEMILNFTQTKTSRHIYYLKNSGLLNSENKDQFIFYSLREEALDIIDQIFEFLDKDEQLKKDLEAYDIMYSNRELARNKIEIKTWKQ